MKDKQNYRLFKKRLEDAIKSTYEAAFIEQTNPDVDSEAEAIFASAYVDGMLAAFYDLRGQEEFDKVVDPLYDIYREDFNRKIAEFKED